jgi:Cellulose binding domain
MAKAEPKVQVRYLIDGQSGNGFQGQVQVVNHGTQPIADWQIVIALPDDIVTSISNASGFVSHGILLMQPAVAGEVVPPDGGTLNVFFVAEGFETTPTACAFNETACT